MGMGTNGSQRLMEQISTVQQEAILLGSSLRIEFLLCQNHGQIGTLCLNQ
jgi:hypothetical protein